MNDKDQIEILKIITREKRYAKSFKEVVRNFDNKFEELLKNSFKIEKYFGEKSGQVRAKEKLLNHGQIQEGWLSEYERSNGKVKIDFKGLYVFLHENRPFYVGISKGVIGRIIQHVKGTTHHTSSLAYKIGLEWFNYNLPNNENYSGTRGDFGFKENVVPVKKLLLKQKIACIHIENDEELYLFEVYCAMKLKTYLNKFETH